MAAVDDPKTFGRARTSFADPAEIDEFVTKLEAFESGELGPDQWRAFRLLRGTYGQRQPDVQMIRVKIPQGLMDTPADPRAGRRGRALFARVRAHHHASEPAVSFREAGRRRERVRDLHQGRD